VISRNLGRTGYTAPEPSTSQAAEPMTLGDMREERRALIAPTRHSTSRQRSVAVVDVSKVLAVELQQVERVQHRLSDSSPPMQGVEYRNPIRATDAGFAV
jgi:hypothetical protein